MSRIVPVALFIVTVLGAKIQSSLACNGYQLALNNLKECDKKNIIRLEDFQLTLDKDCNLIASGCVEIVKDFSKAKVHYMIAKSGFPLMEGDTELCDVLGSNIEPSVTKILDAMNLPTRCPVKATKVCADKKKFNIEKYKNLFPMVQGNIVIKSSIVHDVGKSCHEIKLTLKKGKSG